MTARIIQIEADSMEEAERQLDTLDTDAFIVLKKSVLSREKAETIEEIVDTVEEALTKAKNKIPTEAKIEKEEIKIEPNRTVLHVKAKNEKLAETKIELKKAEIIESISLHKQGRRRFFFFKTRNVYEVAIFQKAVVEIRFRTKARLQVTVQGYLAGDLCQSAQELRSKNADWMEVIESLNPKKDAEIRSLLVRLQDSYQSELLSFFNLLETVCLKNEQANWQTAIREIHWRGLDELNKKKVRLRKLDVEIAEIFMFYTALDWYEKDYSRKRKEPTGLPRRGYDENHVPPPTSRRTIPRYSTDKKAFCELEGRVKGWKLYEDYLECLKEEDEDETTATLEQKCVASLKAKKLKKDGK